MVETVKAPKKREPRVPSRKQMTMLWVAVATALGGQGIPRIIELLQDRPSVEQVQTLVAKQTEALTTAQHQMTDAVKDLDVRLRSLRQSYGQVEGRTELIRDVLRDCCTRKQLQQRLEDVVSSAKPGDDSTDGTPLAPFAVRAPDAGLKASPTKINKVPEFNASEQLQVQEPITP